MGAHQAKPEFEAFSEFQGPRVGWYFGNGSRGLGYYRTNGISTALPSSEQFQASETYDGERPGWFFGTGPQGTGYYHPVVAESGFIASSKYTGPRPGMLFTTGPMGTGYYRDSILMPPTPGAPGFTSSTMEPREVAPVKSAHPVSSEVEAALIEMGFSEDKVHRAIVAVSKRKTSGESVTTDEAIEAILSGEIEKAAIDDVLSHPHSVPPVILLPPPPPAAPPPPHPSSVLTTPESRKAPEPPRTSSASATQQGSNMCIVCFQNEIDSVFSPCGHLSVCFSCASAIKTSSGACPVCRSPISAVIKVFRT